MKHWNPCDYSFYVSSNRRLLQRIFYTLALCSFGLDFWQHILIYQIGSNPLLNQDVDPVYMLFMMLGIPHFISGWAAPFFDALLILSCLASIFWPNQKASPLLFFILYIVYFIVGNMLSGHHYTNIGLLVMAFPFIFSKPSQFVWVYSLCRFFLCFMMVSAACWKIIRGNLWHVDQTNMMLILTHLETLVHEPGSGVAMVVKWLLYNRLPAHAIWVFLIFIEGVFILGFINLKWDRILLVAYLLFFVGGWLIFNIYNFENLLLLLTLTPILAIINRFKQPENTKMRGGANVMTAI